MLLFRTRFLLPLAVLAGLPGLAPRASAQIQIEEWHSIELPPELGDLDPCVGFSCGRLFGKVGTDAVLLYGSRPIVYKEPEVYRAPVEVPVVASDLVVYPRPLGTPDWLFAVGPEGLTRWSWDGAQFVDDSRNFPASPWIGAQEVGLADLDGNGSLDLYGLDATRTTVILSRFVASVWEASVVVPFGQVIDALVPVRWSGRPLQELALRSGADLWVIDFRGALVGSCTFAGTPGEIAAIRIPGSAHEALMVSDGGRENSLTIFSNSAPNQVLALADHAPVGLAVGDLDLDGAPDFILSHPAAPALDLWGGLIEQGELFFAPYPHPDEITIQDWPDFAWNQAPPGLTDFDHDGDLDVFFSPVGTDRVDLFSNAVVDEDDFMCHPLQGAMTVNATGGVFELELRVPPAFQSGDWTDMELIVWRQPRFDYLVESTPHMPPAYVRLEGQSSVVLEVQTPYQSWFPDIYHVEARLVRREQGLKVRQGPGETAMLGLSEPLLALCEIEGVLGQGGEFTGVTFEVPPQFEFPFPTGIEPVPVGGVPNPRYEGNDVVYTYNAMTGTWGGGSGCLPDVPDAGTGDPPKN